MNAHEFSSNAAKCIAMCKNFTGQKSHAFGAKITHTPNLSTAPRPVPVSPRCSVRRMPGGVPDYRWCPPPPCPSSLRTQRGPRARALRRRSMRVPLRVLHVSRPSLAIHASRAMPMATCLLPTAENMSLARDSQIVSIGMARKSALRRNCQRDYCHAQFGTTHPRELSANPFEQYDTFVI